MKEKFFIFQTDNDGHHYLIPEEDNDLFNALLEEAEDINDHRMFLEKFEDNLIGSHCQYKFQNPVER